MKVHLTHNTKIKIFDDAVRHLELEENRLESFRLESKAYVADVRVQKNKGSKHKFKGKRGKEQGTASKKPRTNQQGKRNVLIKNDKLKLKCFNYGNKGYFANECLEPKKVNVQITHECVTNVLSTILLIESSLLWIVESSVIDHITNLRDVFVDSRRVPTMSKWICVGNNNKVEVLGIGTCKLVLCGRRTYFYMMYCMLQRFDKIWFLSFY